MLSIEFGGMRQLGQKGRKREIKRKREKEREGERNNKIMKIIKTNKL